MFDLFDLTNYTFLQLDSAVVGNIIVAEFPAEGIVKIRDGMVQSDNKEAYTSTSTVHIKATEPFIATVGGNLVGHGIRTIDGTEYRIEGQLEGKDFDKGTVEFYKVTLKRENIASWDQSDLPLE